MKICHLGMLRKADANKRTQFWTLRGVVTCEGHLSLKREANSDMCDCQ